MAYNTGAEARVFFAADHARHATGGGAVARDKRAAPSLEGAAPEAPKGSTDLHRGSPLRVRGFARPSLPRQPKIRLQLPQCNRQRRWTLGESNPCLMIRGHAPSHWTKGPKHPTQSSVRGAIPDREGIQALARLPFACLHVRSFPK